MTVDIIDYRSKNSNVADETDCHHNNQENVDLFTEHKDNKGILLIVFIPITVFIFRVF